MKYSKCFQSIKLIYFDPRRLNFHQLVFAYTKTLQTPSCTKKTCLIYFNTYFFMYLLSDRSYLLSDRSKPCMRGFKMPQSQYGTRLEIVTKNYIFYYFSASLVMPYYSKLSYDSGHACLPRHAAIHNSNAITHYLVSSDQVLKTKC